MRTQPRAASPPGAPQRADARAPAPRCAALDTVAQLATAAGVEVQGLLDAAALVDIDPANGGWSWSSQLTPLQTLIGEVTALVNPQLPASCTSQFQGQEWKCAFGQYRLPMVQTRAFINAPQYDSFEIDYDTDNYAPLTTQQLNFVNSFQSAILNLISSIPSSMSVYSSTCFVHCLSGQATFYDFTVDGITLASAVSGWYFGGNRVEVVSSCRGWQCTQQCGLNPQGLACNMGTPGCQLYPAPEEGANAPRGATAPGTSGSTPTKEFPVSLAAFKSGSQSLKADGPGAAPAPPGILHSLSSLFMSAPISESTDSTEREGDSWVASVMDSTPPPPPGGVASTEGTDQTDADPQAVAAEVAQQKKPISLAAALTNKAPPGANVQVVPNVAQSVAQVEPTLSSKQQQELYELTQGQERLQAAAQALGRRRLTAKRCCGDA